MFKYLLLSIFTTILINCTLNAKAQHYFKTSNHRNIHISPADRKIDATIIITAKNTKGTKRLYYWFDNSEIHHTQGGCGGYLLDGDYTEYFYPGNNLSVKGKFRKGLKDGIWCMWYENGNIKEKVLWKKGYLNGRKYYYTSTGAIYKVEKYRRDFLNGFTVEWTSDTSAKKYFYRNGRLCSPNFWNKIGISFKKERNEKQTIVDDKRAVVQNDVDRQEKDKKQNLPPQKKHPFQRFWNNTKSKWPF